jgi:hypothetical protein
VCPHCASTPHRQPNAAQAGAQLPTRRWLTKFLFHFSLRQPLVQTFLRSVAWGAGRLDHLVVSVAAIPH